MFKKMMAFLLCAMMLVSLVACGGDANNDDNNPAGPKEHVIIGTGNEFTTTDPQGSNSQAPLTLATLTHETLTEVDAKGNVIPGLATYEQPDALTYIFTIPAGVTFTNGYACTADDIAFTFERAKESSFTSGKVSSVASVEVLSDTQIKITLSAPNQDFLTTTAHKGMSILSRKACTENPEKGFEIGTGRYYLTKWVPADVTELERYDGYHGEKAVTKTITFRHIAETSARIIALQNKEVDIALGLESLDVPTIESDKNLELVKIEDVQCKYLTFNVNAAPFNDVKVRQAISHAVNKDNIIIGATNGEGKVHTSVVNKTQFGLDETLQGYKYDTAKAKQLLTEAGYPNGLTITLSCYKGSPFETIAAVFQADAAPAGITIKINPVEPAALKAMMKEGSHEMAIYGWTDAIGTDYTVRSLLYSTSGSNRCKIADPELDAMIDAALCETDTAKREQMYKDIQKWVNDRALYIMLYTGIIYNATANGTTGVVWNANNIHDFCYVSVPAK